MGGDHKCPVCGSTFTRSQHVARHMRSHTGDRPYKCVHCGDQFARSDLLSRHVNKCHSIDKKPSNQPNTYRRKQQQPQRPPTVPTATHQTPQPQPPTGPLPSHPLYAHDGYGAVYQQSPRRYSSDAPDPPSLSSSSVTSMSSASLDSLPHSVPPSEPVFHLPQGHYQPQASRQWTDGGGLPPYSYLPPNENMTMFKQEPYQPSLNSSGAQQYNDLPTPMAYPGGPFRMEAFIPNNPQNMAGMPMDNGIYMPITNQPQNMPNPRAVPNGRGAEFSSVFGLMSLDDAAVMAGMASDGVPFFETQSGSEGLHNLLPSLSHQAAQQASNGSFASMSFTNPDPNQNNAQTPNTRERELRTIREMWAAFLRDPTTGLKADGTEMGKPEFPTPPSFQQNPHPPHHLHRRSSSYSGGLSGLAAKLGQPMAQYSHMAYQPQHQIPPVGVKSPHMPTAQHTLHGGTNVVKKLEDQASKIEGDNPMAGTPAPVGTGLATSPESLRSYEEAILARKAPVLKLPAKMKTRESSGSANSNSGGAGGAILPSISQSARATTVGGGVASLSIQQQQQLPTAAGASGVPPGTTPNTALYASQSTMAERPVIAMPKSRSRPTTANGPGSRPNTAGGGTANSAQGSQPPSRPGTASSQGGAGGASGVLSPRQLYNSTQSSPHPLPNGQSLPGSRPSTSSAPSPSYSFAFAPPLNSFHNYANFQPGSLPSDSMRSPTSATSASTSHQLVTALSNAGMLDMSTNKRGRPTYKRLASQVLEPSSSKRPHLRRGDTNFNPTSEGQGNDGAMDGFDSEGMSDTGGSERAYGYGPGFGHDEHGIPGFINGARRMSEPAVAAPRMMMRMPEGGGSSGN